MHLRVVAVADHVDRIGVDDTTEIIWSLT